MSNLAFSQSPARYNVIWDSPSKDANGSMPLGNGDISANAWIEPNGDLCFYIGKTDSWDDNGRLLKVGKVRVKLDPAPTTTKFRQELSLADGTLKVSYGDSTTLHLWVDANHPVIHCSIAVPKKTTATASLELWRTSRTELPTIEISDTMFHRGKPKDMHAPTVVEPDTLLKNLDGRIGWYHRNIKSVGPTEHAETQGVADFPRLDPLLHRTFGGILTAKNGKRIDDETLQSPLGERHQFSLYVLTQHPATAKAWQSAIEKLISTYEKLPAARYRRDHELWWRNFWNRSWIQASSKVTSSNPAPTNNHPFRVGVSQSDSEHFPGDIRNPSVPTKFDGAFLASAEIRQTKDGSGRIFDKVTVGASDGFLLDVRPDGKLRLVVGDQHYFSEDVLPKDRWLKVQLSAAVSGWTVTLDGKPAIQTPKQSGEDDATHISRMFALQRFITACAGRGAYPIKFNGSIFTVPFAGAPGDADYRRWGPGYWWQNTRIPYLSAATNGDLELLEPLFAMYADRILPLNKFRTERYFGFKNAAYFAECIHFWGDVFNESYGWTPWNQRKDPLQESGWHKWEWVAGPELVWMMLEAYEHGGNDALLAKRIIPTTEAIVNFFDSYYKVGSDGKLLMHPSQSLETWWDCDNPMPEVAGLHATLDKLLALPKGKVPEALRTHWTAFKKRLPDLPTRMIDGKPALAPATRFAQKNNIENGELYAVFPFRLCSFEKPNRELGIRALDHRWDKGASGWRQDDIFMAYLGLADQAKQNLVSRARSYDRNHRFPAFWGPNYDWTPDQDHGGILMKTFQSMLLQTDGDKVFLTPAWPKEWDAKFKLHAPKKTVIEGEIRGGKIFSLKVTPESRRKDVVVIGE